MQQINSLDILEVLEKLRIKYSISWDTINLFENDKWTDGRKWLKKNNFVNDFSSKGRASWPPYAFVKSYLDLSDKETFQRFKDEFNISDSSYNSLDIRKKSFKKFNSNIKKEAMKNNNDYSDFKSFKYLSEDRAINKKNIELLRSTWNLNITEDSIEFTMKDLVWSKIWTQVRFPFNSQSPKSKSTPWSEVWYFYIDELDTSEPIIVVEWEIDFISICPLSNNVIGTQWIHKLKDLVQGLILKWFIDIYLLIDKDKHANQAIASLGEVNIPDSVQIFDCRWALLEFKDVNEVLMNWWEITIDDILNQVLERTLISLKQKNSWWKDFYQLSTELIKEYWIQSVDKSCFSYSQDLGLYRLLKTKALEKIIKDKIYDKSGDCKPNHISSVLSYIQMDSQSSELESVLNNEGYLEDKIYLKDWIYSVSTSQLKSYTPEDYVLSKLDFNYLDMWNSSKPIQRINFLEEIFLDRDDIISYISLIQERFWYCLLNSAKFSKSLILYGSWANWKSVIVDVLQEIIGKENTASISCEELRKDNVRIQLLGKNLIVDEDMSHHVKIDSWVIKKIVSWQAISWKRLYENNLSFNPYWKLIIATNNLPKIQSMDHSAKRRFIFLELRQSFLGREDFDLLAKLLLEKEDIFARAFKWLLRLITNQWFTIPKEIEDSFDQIYSESDIIQQFLDSGYIENDKELFTYNRNIMNSYKKFCIDHWFSYVDMNMLWRALKKKWYRADKRKWQRWYRWLGQKNLNTKNYNAV